MARMTMESIDAKIKKAEERVIRTGEIYNLACEEMSYDLYSEGTDDDAIFLSDIIEKEKNPELKEAIIDLKDFIFPY